jgi:hypothetical protein
MTEFLVELYVSRTNCTAAAVEAERLVRAAAELTAEGTPVRLVQSIVVPEDETCFLLVEAATTEHVRETAQRAALLIERIVETADHPTLNERSNTA